MTPIDLDAKYPGTDITAGELLELGEMALNAVGAMVSHLGHDSIGGLTAYALFPATRMGDVMRALSWSAVVGKSPERTEAREVVAAFLDQSGWLDAAAARLSE